CTIYARGGGYCGKHGGSVNKRFCLIDGCKKQAHANQKCVRHGGGRFCKVDGCTYHPRAGGFCLKHQTSSPPKSPPQHEVLDEDILECLLNVDGDSVTLSRSSTAMVIDPLEMTILESLLSGM
ncbi:hypothetical protein THRCLA_22885, partial [Thraustotheca clavata]